MALWVSEYGRVDRGSVSQSLGDGNLQLADDDFESLLTLLEENGQSELEPVLKHTRVQNRDVLTVQGYVGVLHFESGRQIEILPKISKATSAEQGREILVKMLVELRNSPFKRGVISALDVHKIPLFELLMRQFLDGVSDIVRQGIARTYVDRQDNLIFLRGKLLLAEHIKRNTADKSRLYCEFDEFEIDRPINRLIKSALEIVAKSTKDASNQQLCRELLFWFDGVPSSQDIASEFRAVRYDRFVQHYQPVMPLCHLILEGLNPLTKPGETKAISMLFPMHQVFEDYVSAKLKTQLRGWEVRSQVSRQSLVEEHMGSKWFRLNPDLEFRQTKRKMIGDAKWKIIDQHDRISKYQISQSDMYQLFAYAKKYLKAQPIKQVILIYPRTDRFQVPLEPFWFRHDDEVLYVLPFDLEQERLITSEGVSPFDEEDPFKGALVA